MSCERLTESSGVAEEFDDLPPDERALALEHLETCAPCRRAVLAVDPTLVFSLGASRSVPAPSDKGEVERMLLSVEALRRTSALRTTSSRSAAKLSGVAAAVLVAAVLFLSNGVGRSPVETADSSKLARSPFSEVATESDPIEASAIEDLDRPLARVYQLTEEDLSVVMIVDETLDI